jgi:hypothetical protein
MRKPYTSTIRIRRKKPTTAASRRLAAELRAIIRNRRTRKADRLTVNKMLDIIAPPVSAPNGSGLSVEAMRFLLASPEADLRSMAKLCGLTDSQYAAQLEKWRRIVEREATRPEESSLGQ